ncbi:hypothetical protein BT96DRAFT_921249 [Gymnopus androsaceus JB14]|uniref:Uncharacterized protein n=1 Tax=Gymnopus androsaceus JB14 TaxID=1447944 RepID=A0A6A4HJE3_9AGAR|nr:hypothetical protein BT96DRAFT_928021 [Gymnopus androsaceus JB14]KAE9397810.1 hypothetical protein BT96DRAFT_921249 [Gymnopus androsaceus JB14]
MNGFVQDCTGHYGRLELDWTNLTELTLQPAIGYRESALSPQEILNILARTRRLQTLTILIDIVSDWVLADGNAVVNLPEMCEMQLILSGSISPYNHNNIDGSLAVPTFVPIFFRFLLCPSLKRFSVRSSRKGLIDMLSALPSRDAFVEHTNVNE